MVLPAMLCVGVTIYCLGTDELRSGVGAGHLQSILLIPMAAMIGAFLVKWRRKSTDLRGDSMAAVQ